MLGNFYGAKFTRTLLLRFFMFRYAIAEGVGTYVDILNVVDPAYMCAYMRCTYVHACDVQYVHTCDVRMYIHVMYVYKYM